MDYISLLTQVLVHIIHTGSYDVCAVAASGSYQPLDMLAAMIDRLQLTTTYTIYIDTLPASARCNMLVAFVHDATEFDQMFSDIETKHIVSSHLIVVICSRNEQLTIHANDTVQAVLDRSWDLRLVNVVALVASADGLEVHAFTYTPYAIDHCEHVEPFLMLRIPNNDVGMSQLHSLDFRFWFADKLSNLHGCPLYVATLEWDPYIVVANGTPIASISNISRYPPFWEFDGQWLDGIEGRLVLELSVRMRFAAKVLFARANESTRGMELEDGTFSGITGMVSNEAANMSIGMIGPSLPIGRTFRFTFPYYYDSVVFALPHGRVYTSIEKLLLPFTTELWLCCAAFFVVATALLWALSGRRRRHGDRAISTALVDMFSVFLGGGYTRGGALVVYSTEHSWLMLWLMIAMVLRTVYQAFMFTFMQQNPQVLPPDTASEMNRLGYRFMLDKESIAYFQSYPELHGNFLTIPPIKPSSALDQLTDEGANERKGIMIYGKDMIKVYNKNKQSENKPYQVVRYSREKLFVATSVLLLSNRTIFCDHFNRQLLRMASMGFVKHAKAMLIDGGEGEQRPEGGVEFLSVMHVLGVFEIYACMMMVSTLVFGLEWLSNSRFNARLKDIIASKHHDR